MQKRASRTIFLSIIVLVLLAVVLGGCSQKSLFNLMGNEQEEEFSLSVESVQLKVDAQYQIDVEGGFLPYTYSVSSGSGDIDSESGLYTAPSSVAEEKVEVIDQVGHIDYATVRVYEPIVADLSAFSIRVDDPDGQEILVSGGMGELSLSAELGSISPAGINPEPEGSVWYDPPAVPGTDYIHIEDEQGNSLSIKVDVLNSTLDIELEVLPSYAVLGPEESQVFTVTNNTGNSLTVELSAPFGSIDTGTIDTQGETSVTYTAPSEAGAVYLTVSDEVGGTERQAEIYVQDEVAPLEISPSTVEVSPGSTLVEFTASGGVPPYEFTRINGTGTLLQTSPTTADYSPESEFSMIRVIDAVESQADVKIKVK